MIKKIAKKIKSLFTKSKTKVVVEDEKLPYTIMSGAILSGINTIGDNTYIGFNCNITESKIGRYCSIANNVSIGIGEHKINRVSTSSIFYKKPFETLTEKDCIIGNDVWIGSNVVVRRGVEIGDGAIIGANSFVNKNVKEFEIVGGVPSKHIRMRFNEETIITLKKSKWWLLDLEKAKRKILELEKTNLFDID
ncbi:CatB-related O-acetyltransferase [Polaribacter pectinis]|uniref:CatB-related O-acetyltransferase n=1 Tax=Polaribacter pectinis TaxID=2738844 RepID=A0A7G9LCA2_9FLAO|nr:CatB-related O-acetyltransferase [Polaribacter pectinis]QNM86251.1 CatB-related O-acetyltransferase [Polaribacter pectinis]